MSELRLCRRSVLRIGTSAVFGALVARHATPAAAQEAASRAKARGCILLWLNGGPSHIDTFDPKPGRATGGSFKAVKTCVHGVLVAEHLPKLADRMDRVALVRSMSSKEGNHARAQYYVHTGYAPNPTVVHPSLGGWVAARAVEPHAELPPFVSIGGPSFGAGFLGVENGPFVIQKAGASPADVDLAPGVDEARFERRRAALDALEERFAGITGDAKVHGRREIYAQAVRLMRAPGLAAFDVSTESDATRAAYGDTDFGRGCLVARRLVERGVRFVEVVLDGWDTHQNNFERTKALSQTLDTALAALLDDLRARGVVDQTLVACMGEFGRTPRINANDGRDHWPQAWTALLAGGGLRGGVAHGATDEDGAKVLGTPTTVPDLLATMASALGLDPGHTESTPAGRPISVTDGGAPLPNLIR
ncbi:MAG TPA: DUF1501 domain-containing protein [Polyangiaceae bacterium]|nr:DUF1501 domain-containing protein [Polyangiaceae bacterium]